MRIASFNVQNLRLRRNHGRGRLDGARDDDAPPGGEMGARALDFADRRLTARLLSLADADILCLQEVFDRATLDYFLDHLMPAAGGSAYPHRICLPGNDGHGRDVALASRLLVIESASHARLTPRALDLEVPGGIDPDRPVFRRDCLLVKTDALTLFLCHFKAPIPDAATAFAVRQLEASAVRRIVERRFATPADAMWLVLGDLNEPGDPLREDTALSPLLGGFSVDLSMRMRLAEQWSHYDGETGGHSLPDRFLASPALADRFPEACPVVLRQGMSGRADDGPRLDGVGAGRPHASDHALIVLDLPGL